MFLFEDPGKLTGLLCPLSLLMALDRSPLVVTFLPWHLLVGNVVCTLLSKFSGSAAKKGLILSVVQMRKLRPCERRAGLGLLPKWWVGGRQR